MSSYCREILFSARWVGGCEAKFVEEVKCLDD